MAYPTLPIEQSSRFAVESGTRIDRASNGAARGRRMYSAEKRAFVLRHPYLDATQAAALLAFYAANKDAEFDLVLLGTTYTCIFADAPQPAYHSGGYTSYTVELAEV